MWKFFLASNYQSITELPSSSVLAHGLVNVSFTFVCLVVYATGDWVLLLVLNNLVCQWPLSILIEDEFGICTCSIREKMHTIFCFVTGRTGSICASPLPYRLFLLFFSFSSQLCESFLAMSDILTKIIDVKRLRYQSTYEVRNFVFIRWWASLKFGHLHDFLSLGHTFWRAIITLDLFLLKLDFIVGWTESFFLLIFDESRKISLFWSLV